MRSQVGWGKIEVSLGVLLLVGVGLLAWSMLRPTDKGKLGTQAPQFSPQPGQYGPEAVKAIQTDMEMLQAGEAEPELLADALKRLSYAAQDHARGFAFKFKDHPSPALKKASVEALGGFPDAEALQVLTDALASDDKELRLVSLESFGRLQSAYRAYQLKEFLKTAQDPDETMQALASLYKCSNQRDERADILKKIFSEFPERLSSRQTDVAIDLLPRLTSDPIVISRAKSWLLVNPSDQLATRSLQYLQAHAPSDLKGIIPRLTLRPDPSFRSALMSYYESSCPEQVDSLKSQIQDSGVKSLSSLTCP